jgi:hypothetical protein
VHQLEKDLVTENLESVSCKLLLDVDWIKLPTNPNQKFTRDHFESIFENSHCDEFFDGTGFCIRAQDKPTTLPKMECQLGYLYDLLPGQYLHSTVMTLAAKLLLRNRNSTKDVLYMEYQLFEGLAIPGDNISSKVSAKDLFEKIYKNIHPKGKKRKKEKFIFEHKHIMYFENHGGDHWTFNVICNIQDLFVGTKQECFMVQMNSAQKKIGSLMNSPIFLGFLAYTYFEEHSDKVDINRGAFKKSQFYSNLEKSTVFDAEKCAAGLISNKKNNNLLHLYEIEVQKQHNLYDCGIHSIWNMREFIKYFIIDKNAPLNQNYFQNLPANDENLLKCKDFDKIFQERLGYHHVYNLRKSLFYTFFHWD